jgi:CRISPR-associated endonuclease/helicase Cas3
MTGSSKRWVRDVALLAEAAGLGHDIGKVADFQDKLRSAEPLIDPVRHEWISLFLLRSMCDGATWEEAWLHLTRKAAPEERWANTDPFDSALSSMRDVLLYIVATHHRLPTMKSSINHYNHVRDDEHVPKRRGDLAGPTLQSLSSILERVRAIDSDAQGDQGRDRLYWRSVATVARAAMILADQTVSKQMVYEKDNASRSTLYANTDRATGQLNQSLDWHLQHVAATASTMVENFDQYVGPELSPAVVKRITSDVSRRRRFLWQRRAALALERSRALHDSPHLVLNIAGTGTGKTRMNVRAVCALGNQDGTGIRFMTALNLRTLTLQTRDAYSDQLKIPRNMLAGVIGDKPTLALHNFQKQLARRERWRAAAGDANLVDDDENVFEDQFETVSDFEYRGAPEWLNRFLIGRPVSAKIIGAPVLVSTIDFLIAAGEPQMQGNHALALLRLQSSDLILDEIDSYDPAAMLSVMRLVTLSAFFGRNVIASSATLPRPVARMLWVSYRAGAMMRARRTGAPAKFVSAIIDNDTVPTIGVHRKVEGFMRGYEAHVKRMLKKLKGKTERRTLLQEVFSLSEPGWLKSIQNACLRLHEQNCWMDPVSRKTMSFGLVRVANIHVAVKVAHYLSAALGDSARIVCYHSQHFMLQRFHIEHKLDLLLTRHNGNAHIVKDRDVRDALESAPGKTLQFIVVATPVEEIGRDHDFDWCVAEPSSVQSLIQAAGRVNRHRLVKLGWYRYKHAETGERRKCLRANVAILQYNYRAIVHMFRSASYRAFCQPGLELEHAPYPSHNMLELLDWDLLRLEQIDARQRFYDAKLDRRKKNVDADPSRRFSFAHLDDAAMEEATHSIFDRMLGETARGNEWMGLNTYLDSPLRDQSHETIKMLWREPEPSNLYLCRLGGSYAVPQTLRVPVTTPRVANDWLVLDDEQLLRKARLANLEQDDAMQVNVGVGRAEADGSLRRGSLLADVVHDRSFGFFRNTQR